MKKIKLDDIEKIKAPYEVPDSYFSKLESQIQQQITTKVQRTYVPRLRWAVVPALLALLISSVIVISNLQEPDQRTEAILAAISDEEILSYLAYSELSEEEILSLAGHDEVLFSEDPNYLEDIELGDEDLDELIDQLELESEYM